MAKNVVMPLDFVMRVFDLLESLDIDEIDKNYNLPLSESNAARIRGLRLELENMLREKVEKVNSRREFIAGGGRFGK